jgi:hypothetical protein
MLSCISLKAARHSFRQLPCGQSQNGFVPSVFDFFFFVDALPFSVSFLVAPLCFPLMRNLLLCFFGDLLFSFLFRFVCLFGLLCFSVLFLRGETRSGSQFLWASNENDIHLARDVTEFTLDASQSWI